MMLTGRCLVARKVLRSSCSGVEMTFLRHVNGVEMTLRRHIDGIA